MIWRIATLGSVSFVAAVLGVWVGDRSPPVVIERVDLLTSEVAPGGELLLQYHVLRNRSCNATSQKMLIDSTSRIDVSEELEVAPPLRPLGQDVFTSSTTVPKTFAHGPAIYRSGRRYICNPIHSLWPIYALVAEVHFTIKGEPLQEPIEVLPRR